MFFSARDSISNFFSKTTWLLNLSFCSLFDHGRKSANNVVFICLSFYGSVSLGETPTQEVKHLVLAKNTSQSAFHTNSWIPTCLRLWSCKSRESMKLPY